MGEKFENKLVLIFYGPGDKKFVSDTLILVSWPFEFIKRIILERSMLFMSIYFQTGINTN